MPRSIKPSKKKIRTAAHLRYMMFKRNPAVRVRFSDQITRDRKEMEANRVGETRHLKGQAKARKRMLERKLRSLVRFPKYPFPNLEEIKTQGEQTSLLRRAFSSSPDDIFYSSCEETVDGEQPFAAGNNANTSRPLTRPIEQLPSAENVNPPSMLNDRPISHNQETSSAPADRKLSTLQKIVKLFAGQKRLPKVTNSTQRDSPFVPEVPTPKAPTPKAPTPEPKNEGICQNVSKHSSDSKPRRILTAGHCTIIDSLPLNDPYFHRCQLQREAPAPGHATVGIVPEKRRCNRMARFVMQCPDSFITSWAPLLPYARTRTYETVFDRRKDLWPKWAIQQSDWPRRYI